MGQSPPDRGRAPRRGLGQYDDFSRLCRLCAFSTVFAGAVGTSRGRGRSGRCRAVAVLAEAATRVVAAVHRGDDRRRASAGGNSSRAPIGHEYYGSACDPNAMLVPAAKTSGVEAQADIIGLRQSATAQDQKPGAAAGAICPQYFVLPLSEI